jgi:predicted nuclease of predicted toxin-antitoxin system
VRVLLDACVWGGAKAKLASAGLDIVWVGDWKEDPGDDQVIARALAENRVVVTLDKDFGELAIVHGTPHCGIIRLVGIPARRQGEFALAALQRYETELARGAFVTVDLGRVRIHR